MPRKKKEVQDGQEKSKEPTKKQTTKKPRTPRPPKAPPIPKVAEYNDQGKEICPACKERKFRTEDCSSDGQGNIIFKVKCPCGHKFQYSRDVKKMWVKKERDLSSGFAEAAATKLHELPEPGNKSGRTTRRRSAGRKR